MLGGATLDGNIPLPLMTKGRDLSDAKVNAWREIIEACFQGERLSQGKNERYDFRVIPFVKGGDIIHMKGERVIRDL
jgi:hypothetical protein